MASLMFLGDILYLTVPNKVNFGKPFHLPCNIRYKAYHQSFLFYILALLFHIINLTHRKSMIN
ncbi:hypothetical protein ETA_34440 [Erwinia tasmaniensis Et1/99]|uniref:Uncharacterized protein n=1 Tax=Erwinia tasmaniensis (strain DSM 17950 / CFBP 7177 / CIP 109463 / NCPPB 4357 / Et1/99) TaxID=465817 RepID=B2VCD4_ERWT9|nr:hypothetical protein ETA_34440 [Erwinia tasmaniensis Et1/99]